MDAQPRHAHQRPLLITDDPTLLDDLLRLAAAAGVEVNVAHAATHAGRDWPTASLVVVGTDLLPALAALEPERRADVVVAGPETPGSANGSGPAWDAALRIGAQTVLSLPRDETHLADLLAESTETRTDRSRVVSVIGGRGGAGASLLAVALALAGERAGQRVALVDADPHGGGLDLLLGQEHAEGARWGDLMQRQGRMSWPALRKVLPEASGVVLVTWSHGPAQPVPSTAMRAVLASATRGADLVVADLPRCPDPSADEVLRRTSTALLVVPAEVHAVMSAVRLTARLTDQVADLRLVVRGASPAFPAETVANALRLPLAGDIASEPALARTLRQGDVPATRPRSPLRQFADEVVADVQGSWERVEVSE